MTVSVGVPNADISFGCEPDETILDAAERAGFAIPYSCRKGVCSSCAGRLIKGEMTVRGQGIKHGPVDDVLLCQAKPITDVELAPQWIRSAAPVARKTYRCKVWHVSRPIPDVAVIKLRLPIGQRAIFSAGQYLRALMPGGDSRNFSMANPPHKNDELELHIRQVPGGAFSQRILPNLSKGSVLEVEIPYGEFRLSDNDNRTAILLATGTGFAPIKSMVEHWIKAGSERQMHLYWGANTENDLYMAQLAGTWASQFHRFQFTPVVSAASTQWNGRVGFVHKAVMEDYPDMSSSEVYACGAPIMIEAARKEFSSVCKLDPTAFFCDPFVPSGEPEPQKRADG